MQFQAGNPGAPCGVKTWTRQIHVALHIISRIAVGVFFIFFWKGRWHSWTVDIDEPMCTYPPGAGCAPLSERAVFSSVRADARIRARDRRRNQH